jgi:hypothetical protein
LIISNPTPFACTLSGITFNGDNASGNDQIGILIRTPALLHDCNFTSNGGLLDMVRFETSGGVIWNWTFYDNDQNEEAITFKDPAGGSSGVSPNWTTNDTMGMADTNGTANTYVEDCTFNEMPLQALDLDDNSRVVIRYCTFNNSGIASHGLETSPYGTRQWEIYNNNFIFSTSGTSMAGNPFPLNLNWWFFCRGGTGVIFNNVMPDISSQWWGNKPSILFTVFNIRRMSGYVPCQTTWPAIHQVGQGYNDSLVLDPVYIWGNTDGTSYNNPGITEWAFRDCGNDLVSESFIQEGRDYYVNTPKPGYTPYIYPHPLRSTVGDPPSRSPTPAPTPAPVPVLAQAPVWDSYHNWIGQINAWMQQNAHSSDNVQVFNSFIQSDPPFVDPYLSLDFAYWAWQGQLNWALAYQGDFSSQQVQALDAFIHSNLLPTN